MYFFHGYIRLLAASFALVSIVCLLLLSFEQPRRIILSVSDLLNLAEETHQTTGQNGGSYEQHIDKPQIVTCPSLTPFRERYGYKQYEYARAVFRPRLSSNVVHNKLTNVESSTLSSFVMDSEQVEDSPCAIVDIDVAPDPNANEHVESRMLIGYASNAERLKRFAPTILQTMGEHSSVVGLTDPQPDSSLASHEAALHALGINVTMYTSDLPFTSKYFSLINVFAKYTDSHDWFLLLDDDSYLPRTISLIAARLAELSPLDPHFIGVPSDSGLQVSNHGGWAHGGGGIILSATTVSYLAKHFDECQAEYDPSVPVGGDHRLFLCAEIAERYLPDYNITGCGVLSNYTVWPELKQWDLAGAAEGIFESGKEIWTFHHWVSTHWFSSPEHASQSGLATQNSGIQSLLRRFKLNDTTPTTTPPNMTESTSPLNTSTTSTTSSPSPRSFFLLTNAYSILHINIPDPSKVDLNDIDLDKVEYTWLDDAKWFIESQGPTRPKLSDVQGVEARRFRLNDTAIGARGEVHAWYVWDHGESTGNVASADTDVESIIEIVWLQPSVM